MEQIFNWVSKIIRDCIGFCFNSLFDWSRKLAPFSQPIRCKANTKCELVASVFPRFRQFACFNSELSLGLFRVLSFSFNWLLSLILVWFYYIQSKSALLRITSFFIWRPQSEVSFSLILFLTFCSCNLLFSLTISRHAYLAVHNNDHLGLISLSFPFMQRCQIGRNVSRRG